MQDILYLSGNLDARLSCSHRTCSVYMITVTAKLIKKIDLKNALCKRGLRLGGGWFQDQRKLPVCQKVSGSQEQVTGGIRGEEQNSTYPPSLIEVVSMSSRRLKAEITTW